MLKGRILRVDSGKCGLRHGEFQSCLLPNLLVAGLSPLRGQSRGPDNVPSCILPWLVRLGGSGNSISKPSLDRELCL
jgi:hypothetical protein